MCYTCKAKCKSKKSVKSCGNKGCSTYIGFQNNIQYHPGFLGQNDTSSNGYSNNDNYYSNIWNAGKKQGNNK